MRTVRLDKIERLLDDTTERRNRIERGQIENLFQSRSEILRRDLHSLCQGDETLVAIGRLVEPVQAKERAEDALDRSDVGSLNPEKIVAPLVIDFGEPQGLDREMLLDHRRLQTVGIPSDPVDPHVGEIVSRQGKAIVKAADELLM